MNTIKWIIDGWRYWDKTNGNSYHLTRLTNVRTGKSAIFDECEGNVRSDLAKVQKPVNGSYRNGVHISPIENIPYREWRQKLNSGYYAPRNVYERKGGKVINNTVKIIRSLNRV
jgi:hypothetical protein